MTLLFISLSAPTVQTANLIKTVVDVLAIMGLITEDIAGFLPCHIIIYFDANPPEI